jgi:TolB-like protein
VRVSVVNLYRDEVGNPELPEKFKHSPNRDITAPALSGSSTKLTAPKWALVGAVALIIIGALVIGFLIFRSNRSPTTSGSTPPTPAVPFASVPEKSIAVLPFENLSANQENAFFADGVQNEILTDLAMIADLKVISRTSVMQYKNAATRNLSEIAKSLKVAHVLEGSVQRAVNRVRVNAQLIDARTDAHLWARPMTGTLPTFSRSKVRSPKPSPTSFRPSSPPKRKQPCTRSQQMTWWRTIFT